LSVRRCVEHWQAQEPLSEPPQQEAQEEVIEPRRQFRVELARALSAPSCYGRRRRTAALFALHNRL